MGSRQQSFHILKDIDHEKRILISHKKTYINWSESETKCVLGDFYLNFELI